MEISRTMPAGDLFQDVEAVRTNTDELHKSFQSSLSEQGFEKILGFILLTKKGKNEHPKILIP